MKNKLIKKSPWVNIFNAGCNGCTLEIFAAMTPKYDLERFGILWKPSPRHADILLVSGMINKHAAPRLKRIYEQMPNYKKVIAIGACSISGGIFRDSYNYVQVDNLIPVDMYIPGCPPRPEAIIDGILKLIGGKYEKTEN
ncbi:MAG TPA: NADH-quinone oxidoreductase subunit B [Candidatus Woesearchaeota archaeon]|nr:NADH-quinone oxidoreductase subunit B [Candidatus Woesearchaeota archaeon]